MYHRHICAKRTFSQVDNAIFKTLWQWCLRRHPDKGKCWIAQKYFTTTAGDGGGNRWVFFGKAEQADGSLRQVALSRASRVRIRRHTKIRADVNPYAPRWAAYLEGRHSRQDHRSTAATDSTDRGESLHNCYQSDAVKLRTAPRP